LKVKIVWLYFLNALSIFIKKIINYLFIPTLIVAFFISMNLVPFTWAAEPLSLEECIQIALRENPEFLNAERRTAIAKTQKSDAVSAYLPSINAVISSSQTRVGPTINNRVVYQGVELSEGAEAERPGFVTNSHYLGTSISQLLFDGWASINRIKQQKAHVEATLASQKRTRSQVILECKRRFYELRRAKENQQVAAKSLEVAEQQLAKTELFMEGGLVPRLDVYQARVSRNNAKMLLLQAQSQVENVRAELNSYLGRSPNEPLTLASHEEIIRPLQYSLEDAIRIGLENNAYIRSLEQEIKASQYSLASTRSGLLPSISLTCNYYRYNSTFSKVYGQLDKNYSIYYGLTISYNLFDGFRRGSAIQRERLKLSIAEENLQSTYREISAAIASAVRKHTMLLEMLQLQEDNIIEASEARRVAKERYANGQVTLLDVLNAERNFVSTEFQHIGTQFDAIIAEAEIEALLGINEQ